MPGENQLLLKTLQDAGIGCKFGADDFHSDDAIEFLVTRLVNGAHAALSDDTQNLISGSKERSGDEKGRRRHSLARRSEGDGTDIGNSGYVRAGFTRRSFSGSSCPDSASGRCAC